MKKQNLDNLSFIKKTDKSSMLKAISEFPEMMEKAILFAEKTELDPGNDVSAIVICGMGGSAIGGDILSSVLAEKTDLPVQVIRDYHISGIPKGSLVFAVSYSGNTEETLSAFRQADARGLKIVCITSGGKLKDEALAKGYPCVHVPQGYQPRAALGFLFVPMLVILEKIGVIKGVKGDIEKTAKLLRELKKEYGEDTLSKNNPAKKLAQKIRSTTPIIYGSFGSTSAMALRLKTQLNENSKIISFCGSFPEVDHNEIVGISSLKPGKHDFSVIILRDQEESPAMKKRIEATKRLMRKNIKNINEILAKGGSRLEKLISLVFFGDYLSAYVAVINGVDPTPVATIEELKKELAK